jgi:hypothetical protein
MSQLVVELQAGSTGLTRHCLDVTKTNKAIPGLKDHGQNVPDTGCSWLAWRWSFQLAWWLAFQLQLAGVAVGVAVRVFVGVAVGSEVGVADGVAVADTIPVGVEVGVAVGFQSS